MKRTFVGCIAVAWLLIGSTILMSCSMLTANAQTPVGDSGPLDVMVSAWEGADAELTRSLRQARDAGVRKVIVHIENTKDLSRAELTQFEQKIRSVLDANAYTSPDGRIARCERKCGASGPVPKPQPDVVINGALAKLRISAQDGPMPSTRRGLQTARSQRIARVIAQIENTTLVDDPELVDLVELETRQLLDAFGYTDPNGIIVKCPRSCGEPATPPDPPDKGPPAFTTVDARDGPMPPFLAAVKGARERRASRVIVRFENIELQEDPELLELIEMEIRETLQRYRYGPSKVEIIRCQRTC